MSELYRNPISYGRTPKVEAYRIGLCPTCAWPATSIIESDAAQGRTIDCVCGRGHAWTTSWSGQSREIVRPVTVGRSGASTGE
jgi:hypothetical protein